MSKPPDFPAAIERARRAAGLSRLDVARAAGLSGPGISKALRTGANPTLRTMQRLAAAVGCELQVFVICPAVLTLPPRTEYAYDLELVLAA